IPPALPGVPGPGDPTEIQTDSPVSQEEFQTLSDRIVRLPAPPPDLGRPSHPPPRPDESGPRRIGKYQIVRELGRGGMGIVYDARDVLDRRVAMKILPGARFTSPEAVQRLLREARVGASLKHPHICYVLDAGQEGGEFYFVMEFVEGEPLHAVLNREQ